MKKILGVLFSVLISIGFFACDNDSGNTPTIIGESCTYDLQMIFTLPSPPFAANSGEDFNLGVGVPVTMNGMDLADTPMVPFTIENIDNGNCTGITEGMVTTPFTSVAVQRTGSTLTVKTMVAAMNMDFTLTGDTITSGQTLNAPNENCTEVITVSDDSEIDYTGKQIILNYTKTVTAQNEDCSAF